VHVPKVNGSVHMPPLATNLLQPSLYDGLFGEGSLRASANHARVLIWWAWTSRAQLRRVCTNTQPHDNARTLLHNFVSVCALPRNVCTIPLFFHVADKFSTRFPARPISTRRVSFSKTPTPTPQPRHPSTCRTALVCI